MSNANHNTTLVASHDAPPADELDLAPLADETRTTTPNKPATRRRTSAARRADDRESYLQAKAANGDHMAQRLLGWL